MLRDRPRENIVDVSMFYCSNHTRTFPIGVNDDPLLPAYRRAKRPSLGSRPSRGAATTLKTRRPARAPSLPSARARCGS